ncbi:MAG: hypothetical protein WCE94_00665 [Candidatus Methanoperedens sp.]
MSNSSTDNHMLVDPIDAVLFKRITIKMSRIIQECTRISKVKTKTVTRGQALTIEQSREYEPYISHREDTLPAIFADLLLVEAMIEDIVMLDTRQSLREKAVEIKQLYYDLKDIIILA